MARLNIFGEYKVLLYDFWLDPHNAHDLDLTEGIIEFSWAHTDFLICTPKILKLYIKPNLDTGLNNNFQELEKL